MEQRYITLNRVALAAVALVVAAILAVGVYQAATRPIGSGEAYLYDRFVRPTSRQVLASELLDREVLYSLLEKRSVGLFHVSPFAVRLPGILFGVLYLWMVWRLARWLFGTRWQFLAAVMVADWLPFWLGWFSRADGWGVALALTGCAVCLAVEGKYLNLIGVCLGLSIAAEMAFAMPATVLALAMLGVWRRWNDWTDRVFIPAVVVAWIFLVLPLSHADAGEVKTPELTAGQAFHLQTALAALRLSAGTGHIRIGTIPPVEPIVNFYRAQHRASTWERAGRDYSSEHFDYYLLSRTEAGWVSERHLIVLYRDADFVVAR